MIRSNLFVDTDARKIVDKKGCFNLIEYVKDVSITSPKEAEESYYAAKMNIRKRQVLAILNNSGIVIQRGAMQLFAGDVQLDTNVKGTGDLMKKFVGSKVTGESTVKPLYKGTGIVLLEPTYKYIIFEDLSDWQDSMIIEDGLFLACEESIRISVKARSSFSSAIAGGEGLFNAALEGEGYAVLESPVPKEELIVVDLNDDVLKVDGNFAIAWSSTLDFTVERSSKGVVSSAAGGEGLVNVYRGTGRVLLAPVSV